MMYDLSLAEEHWLDIGLTDVNQGQVTRLMHRRQLGVTILGPFVLTTLTDASLQYNTTYTVPLPFNNPSVHQYSAKYQQLSFRILVSPFNYFQSHIIHIYCYLNSVLTI